MSVGETDLFINQEMFFNSHLLMSCQVFTMVNGFPAHSQGNKSKKKSFVPEGKSSLDSVELTLKMR